MMSRLALVAMALWGVSATQQQSHSRAIHFHTHSIDTRHVTHIMDIKHEHTQHGKQQFLIQLEEGQESMKAVVENVLGHSLTHYYPSNAWLTYTTPHTARTISTMPGVAWVGTYEPSYKLHSSITQKNYEIKPPSHDADADDIWMNEDEEVNTKQQYTINVHLQPEDSSDASPSSQSSLATMAQEWLRTADIAGNVEIHGQVMITIHVQEQALMHPLAQHIAQHSRVHYIERAYPNKLLNKWAKSISQWDLPAPSTTTPAVGSLTGAGEVIGVMDTGVDFNSCFFFDPNNAVEVKIFQQLLNFNQLKPAQHRKIVQYVNFAGDPGDDHGHGTHVAGTVAGQSLAAGFASFNGMAPDAKLAIFDGGQQSQFVIPRPLDENLFPWSAAVGAAIHVDAWGSSNPGYDSMAAEFDKYMFNNPNFLAVVAGGNSGTAGITSPATSKNALVVGATVSSKESFLGIFCPPSETNVGGGIKQDAALCALAQTITPNSIANFSSIGLTKDGRIKPDVVAPGMYIASANNRQQRGQSCTNAPDKVIKARAGTSMSAAVVAGDVALLRQYFRGGFYPSGTPGNPTITPSAALLKAIIIDGAVPATQIPKQAAPTIRQQGFGRMVLSKGVPLWGAPFTLLMKRDPTGLLDPFFTRNPNPPPPQDFVFCALPITPAQPTQLKVTLVWTDAPATPNTNPPNGVLVNNLDLQMADPETGNPLFGNGGANPDTKNNVEQIIISTLTKATTMTAKVVANSIQTYNTNNQLPYALVVTGNVLAGACGTTTMSPGMTATPQFLTWQIGEFTTCSAKCADDSNVNGGTQTRTVTCVSSQTGPVADAQCLAVPTLNPKPVTSQTCNTVSCGLTEFEWTMGTFSTCSLPCATPNNPNGGIQTRTVNCQSIATPTTTSVVVEPKFCADHVKPATQQSCNTAPCSSTGMGGGMGPGGGGVDGQLFEWRVSTPSTCSMVCGGGVALRQVTCFIGEIAVDPSFCANLPKPTSAIPCNTQPCQPGQDPNGPTNTPTTSPTTPPMTSTGGVFNNTLPNPDGMNGGVPTPPPLNGNLPAPVQQTFFWQVFDYGPCSVGCADPTNNPNGGMQTRVVKCRSSLGNFDDDARCAPVPKPSVSKPCNMDPCPARDDFNLEWVTGIYGQCDPDTAIQTRWVVCKTTNNQYVDFAQCQAHVGPIPATTQPCTVPADAFNQWQNAPLATPQWQWYAQRFGDCSQWCNGPGTQTRGLHCLAPMGLVAPTFAQCTDLPQPITSQSCGASPCADVEQWYGGDFIGCSDTDPCRGTETRHVFCIDTNGKKLQDTARCTQPKLPTTRSPCGACVPKAQTILGLPPGAIIGIASGVGIVALLGVGYLALQWRRRVVDQNNKVASRIALSKV